jgi:cyanate permease
MVHIIKDEFDITYAQVGFLVSLPLAVLAVAAIPAGMLADRIGVKKATVIGAAMMSAGSFLRGAVSDYRLLYLFTGLFGLGFALVYPNLPKIAHAWFSREKVGLATGTYTTGIALGGTIPYVISLPILLPITNSSQGVFYFWSAPAIAAFVLCWILVKEPPRTEEPSYTVAKDRDSPLRMLRDRNLWFAALIMVANSTHFYVWASWTPSLMVLKGSTPEFASAITSIRGWAGLPAMFLIPFVSYKIGLRKPFFWGSGLLLAFTALWAIYVSSSWGWLLMVFVGVLVSGSFSMILALPAELSGGRSVGSATGMILSIGFVGGLIGPWLAGYLFDISGTLDWTLIGLFVIGLGWALAGALIPETGRRNRLATGG